MKTQQKSKVLNKEVNKIAVLFVRKDSIYKKLRVDCWDKERNAQLYNRNNAIIAHPPCRMFGKLKAFAKGVPGEKQLAYDCITIIRRNGGILEHPRHSSLWPELNLPLPGKKDEYGGYTICINQHWFGHKAEKNTFLYICGIDINKLPAIPITFNAVEYVISTSKKSTGKKECSRKEREATPLDLAKWLIKTAKLIEKEKQL